MRAIHYNDDTQAINGHIQTVTWSIQSFTVRLHVHIVPLVTDMSRIMQVETMLAIEFALDVSWSSVRVMIDAHVLPGTCG